MHTRDNREVRKCISTFKEDIKNENQYKIQ